MNGVNVQLPDTSQLIVSSSPHLHDRQNARKIMLTIILTLLPACVVGVYLFGWQAAKVLILTSLACVVLERLFCKWRGSRATTEDGSALLTGLLLGMVLPAASPWWICLLGALLAMGLGKHLYGGLGYNIFNPALVGRAALLIAFPQYMTTWAEPMPGKLFPDAVTTATPLDQISQGATAQATNYWDFFLGNMPGCIGETSALALLAGGAVLVYFRYIRWQMPVSYIGTVALITGIAYLAAPETNATPLFHVLTGGLILGAVYMATDPVTSPMSIKGVWIGGAVCGIITAAIRLGGNYPEGVNFSILFMNALVPLIDRYTPNKPFGHADKPRTEKGQK